jgi:[ribosomal protein S5]-alanine N-acetyltransferase
MLLITERLILREFTEADLPDFSALMADPEVMRFSVNGPLSQEQAKENLQKRILAHYEHYGFGLCAVILRENNQFIGYAGLVTQTIDGQEEVELGYRLTPKYWGKGLATEAALALCKYAFDHLHVVHLISIIEPQNHRSLKVANRAGMHLWKRSLFHGIPVHIYALHKESK